MCEFGNSCERALQKERKQKMNIPFFNDCIAIELLNLNQALGLEPFGTKGLFLFGVLLLQKRLFK